MKRLLLCFAIVVFELMSMCGEAKAECRALSEAKPDSDCVVMKWGDQSGIWFRMQNALTLKAEHDAIPEYKQQITYSLSALATRDEQMELLRQSITKSAEIQLKTNDLMAKMDKNQEALEKKNKELEGKLESPWHNPVVMMAVGAGAVVVTAAAGAATYAALKH